MVLEKIFLLWQQSWYALVRTPITIWLELIALYLQRFYGALLKSYAFFIVISYVISVYYIQNTLYSACATLLFFSLIIYLMRPTVGLKNVSYLRDYFSLEALTSTLAILFVYLVLAAVLPKVTMVLLFIAALCSFSFLYDAIGSIPDKVAHVLARTGYFLVYKAPVFFSLVAVALAVSCMNFGLLTILLNTFLFYPIYAAVITILYVSALHENYELYYAE